MPTRTITLSIPELCKRLGIKQECSDCGEQMEANQTNDSLFLDCAINDCKNITPVKVLSVGGKYPTDECRNPCWRSSYTNKCKMKNEPCFKPRLATVKNIRLVEGDKVELELI